MEQYHELLKRILGHGDVQFEPRTREYTLGISAWQSVYDLRDGFPLMTTKNVPPRLPFEELFWKLRGERNVKPLVDKNVHIWTANAFDRYLKRGGLDSKFPKHSQEWNEEFEKYKEMIANDPGFALVGGDLGPVYGFQWRHWRKDLAEIDQLANLLKGIPKKPGSRYHVLSSWNVGDLPDMALGPCPFWHQFSVFGKNMDLTTVQRSCDVFLGVPFNIAQDSLLVHMVANETGFEPRFFNHSYVNVHSYLGVPPRADFWLNSKNVREFQSRFKEIEVEERSKYPDLRRWYIGNAPAESPGNEKKDHIPFILEQLSKTPKNLPSIKIKSGTPLLEAIQMPALDYAEILNYNPEKWDSKAEMAA
ncbi:MAG: thymidylate synthase [Nanoarchaeota archaeon]|nr:thymidylate synthase [Nanoarchaeota archaeon]